MRKFESENLKVKMWKWKCESENAPNQESGSHLFRLEAILGGAKTESKCVVGPADRCLDEIESKLYWIWLNQNSIEFDLEMTIKLT